MKTFNAACIAALLATSTMVATAGEPMMDHGDEMKKMDTNGDGMVSKAEFTKFHDAMWMKMPKTSSGMVDIKAMQPMKGSMGTDSMESGSMGSGSMGKGAMGNDSSMGQGSMSSDKQSSETRKK